MRRIALAVAALLSVAAAGAAARADLLHSVLGAFTGRESAAPGFPSGSKVPEWEGYLAQGNVEAGHGLFTTGQTSQGTARVAVCQSCHGANGVPQVGAPMPRLAGVTADYIAKELDDYRANRRVNDVMGPIARAMSPADIGSVALYLASLSPARFDTPPPPGNDVGRHLQDLGDNARAIPACGNCHGPQGWGTDQLLPPLAGLSSSYLRTQLHEWKSAARTNDDEGVMRGIAGGLSDNEIISLSDYYASMR